MAKNDPAPKKQRFYKLIAQAYTSTAPHDKRLLPYMILAVVGPIAIGVAVGLAIGWALWGRTATVESDGESGQ